MDLIDSLTPVAAVLALFAAIVLAVLLVRQGRAMRRLEQRVEAGGGSATQASLERISQLQARMGIDSGDVPVEGPILRGVDDRPRRRVPMVGLVGAVAALAFGGWWFFLRDSTPAAQPGGNATATPTPKPRVPVEGQIPPNPRPLQDKGAFTVAVLNGSDVAGAAAGYSAKVADAGYAPGKVDNEPGRSDRLQSVVMYTTGNRIAAHNVGKDLGMSCCAIPMDGLTPDQVDGAKIVLIVGKDLAQKLAQGTTTTP